jgi:hypothetical protein
LIGIGKAFYCYFKPSSDYWLLAKNRRRIAAMDAFYNRILFLKIFLPISHEPHDFYISVSLVLGIPLVTAGGVWLAWRSGISRAGLDRNQRLLLLFLCVNIVYITLVGNLFESGENNRFRFMIEPSLVALLGVFMQHQWLAKTRRGSRPAGSPGPCAPPAHFGGAAHKGPDYAPLPTTEHVLRQRRTESRLGRQEEAPGGTGDPLG